MAQGMTCGDLPWGFEREVFTIKLSRALPEVNMNQRQGCNMSLVGSHQANVTVNSARSRDQVTPAIMTTPNPRPGHVIITPLGNCTSLTVPLTSQAIGQSSSNYRQQATPKHDQCVAASRKQTENIINKLLVKAVCKSTKKSPKTFTLRDVDIASVNSRDQLKQLIREQLTGDIIKEFNVGYYQGSTVISIRSPQDLAEVSGME